MTAWSEVYAVNNTADKLVSDLLGRVYWCTDAGALFCYDEVTDSSFQLADVSGYILNTTGGTGTPTYDCEVVDIEFHNGMIYILIRDEHGWNGWNFATLDGAYKATFRVVTVEPYSATTSLLCDSWLGTGMDGAKRVMVPDFDGMGGSQAQAASVWNCKFAVWQGRLWVTLESLNYANYVTHQGLPSHEPNTWCVYMLNDSGQFEESFKFDWENNWANNGRFRDEPYLVTDPEEIYVRTKADGSNDGTRVWSRKVSEAWAHRTTFAWASADANKMNELQCAGSGYMWAHDPANTSIEIITGDYGTNWSTYNNFTGNNARATGYFKGITISGWLFGCDDSIFISTVEDFNSPGLAPYNFVYTNKFQYMIDTSGHVWKRGENVGGVFSLGPPMNSMDIDTTGDILYIAGTDVLTNRPIAVYVTVTGIPTGAFGLMAGDNGIAGVRAAGPYDCIGFGRFGDEAQVMVAEGVTVGFDGAVPNSEGFPAASIATALDHDSVITPEVGYTTLYAIKDMYTATGIMGGGWEYNSDIAFNARCMHRMWLDTGEQGVFIGASGITANPIQKWTQVGGWIDSSEGLPTTIITEIDNSE